MAILNHTCESCTGGSMVQANATQLAVMKAFGAVNGFTLFTQPESTPQKTKSNTPSQGPQL